MMKIMISILIGFGWLFFALPTMAQPPDFEELADTIRFIRLAESKRKLTLSEDKLLKVNEILDEFEQKRFVLVKRENELKRMAVEGRYTKENGQQLIDDLLAVRQEIHNHEIDLWNQTKTFLQPDEIIQVWIFYDKFQREVYKKIRGIQDRRANRPGPANRRRKTPNPR